jgi:hypothetical protein
MSSSFGRSEPKQVMAFPVPTPGGGCAQQSDSKMQLADERRKSGFPGMTCMGKGVFA